MLDFSITRHRKKHYTFLSGGKYKSIIQTPFIMGVGGSFDVVAGFVKRAPLWMQNSGLEWLFRIIQELRRMWKRYLVDNSIFIYLRFQRKIHQVFKKQNPTAKTMEEVRNYICRRFPALTVLKMGE